MTAWGILTVFGLAVMFLLIGTIILFFVSAIYRTVAKGKKTKKEKPAGFPTDTLSKAA